MKCCIELVFDEKSQNKINVIRKLLKENGVHDEAVALNHVSIADIDVSNIDLLNKIVKDFSLTHEKFDVTLSNAGSFMTDENVLFFSPTINSELLKYNEDICKELEKNNIVISKYYKKDNWVPHSTLAIRLSNQELKKGFSVLKDNNILPLTVTCDKVDILNYTNKPDYIQEGIYDLKD